jgi:hypothetical protein
MTHDEVNAHQVDWERGMSDTNTPVPPQDMRESEGKIHRADTVPPPADGESHYSAATVVREAPPEVLAAIRQHKALKAAASPPVELPPPPRVPRLEQPATLPDLSLLPAPAVARENPASPSLVRSADTPFPKLTDEAPSARLPPDGVAEEEDEPMTRLHISADHPIVPLGAPLAPMGRPGDQGEVPWWATPAQVPDTRRDVFAWTIAVAVGLTVLVAVVAWLRGS